MKKEKGKRNKGEKALAGRGLCSKLPQTKTPPFEGGYRG